MIVPKADGVSGVQAFLLVSRHGESLVARRKGGVLRAVATAMAPDQILSAFDDKIHDGDAPSAVAEDLLQSGWLPLFGLIFDAAPARIYLVAEGDALRIEPHDFAAAIAALTLTANADGGFVLSQPETGYYMSAPPNAVGGGSVELNRAEAREWEQFTLHAVEAGQWPQGLTAIAEAVASYGLGGFGVDALRAALGAPDSAIGRIVARLGGSDFAPADLEAAGAALLNDTSAVEALARLFPNDPWASLALPQLKGWADGRNDPQAIRPSIRAVDRVWDCAGHDPNGGRLSLPRALNAAARRAVAPRRRTAVVMTARNEGLYLLEWVAWHKALGVDRIFVYSNNNTDGSDRLLSALAKAGEIVWIENSGGAAHPQFRAYGHALSVLPDVLDYEWVAVIDADEFIMLDFERFPDLPAYLDWQAEAGGDSIALNWMVFDGNGHKRWADELTIERFTSREPGPNRHVKAISRPGHLVFSFCHNAVSLAPWPLCYVNDEREPARYEQSGTPAILDVPMVRNAWINHYLFRSAEEFLWKKARGYGDQGNDFDSLFSAAHLDRERFCAIMRDSLTFYLGRESAQDSSAPARAPQLRRELAILQENSEIAAAHAQALAHAREGMDRAIAAFAALDENLLPADLKAQWLAVAGAS